LPERAICVQHQGAFSIRKGQWKLVKGKRFPEEARWELYDIKSDPVEKNNLAASHPELVAALGREWNEWAARTDSWRGAGAAPRKNGKKPAN
jgi:arylsulfatase